MKNFYKSLLLSFAIAFSAQAYSLPILNSLPTSQFTVFLDFDGHYVVSSAFNGGNPINCAPAGMTDAQITNAFNRVAEDYRPFDINITTDSTKFLTTPIAQRIRIIVTPTNYFYPGTGGIAYIGSFLWGNNTPGFVFVNNLPVGGPISAKMVGECCSHESGHSLGLSHQSKYDASSCTVPIEVYHTGIGTGETSWAPIMGDSYSRNMTGWNNGSTNFECTDLQDNLEILSLQNGFGYRVDDYGEVLDGTTNAIPTSSINKSGIITTTTDKDAFKLTFAQNSNLHLVAAPYNLGANDDGANLDVKVSLYNASGVLIKTFDPAASMAVTIDTILNTGSYYIILDGTGNINTSEYGSIGSYTITGVAGALPIHNVDLSGNNNNNKHNLNWNIIADEPIKEIVIEASNNGTSFTPLQTVAGAATKFNYQPYNSNIVYYRLKATSVINQTVYSNIVALKTNGYNGKMFEVSSFVNNDISVNAAEPFQYRISDANGRVVTVSKGIKGINKIDISNQPNGLYTIQIISNNVIQSDRIIKQ